MPLRIELRLFERDTYYISLFDIMDVGIARSFIARRITDGEGYLSRYTLIL